jgi:hypothetical protein
MADTDENVVDADESDTRITHGSYTIKRPGARITLNDNDCGLDSDRTAVAVGSQPDDITGPPGVVLQATLDDGGLLEAYAGLTMAPEEARSVARALLLAADACERDERRWIR